MKVALLSNATTSVLEGMLREKAEVWSPPGHGAWIETALAPPDDLVAFAPELFIILLDRRFAAVEADPAEAVAALRRRFPAAAVVLPDLEAMAAEIGEGFYDERMWKLARMPWSLTGLRELAKLAAPAKRSLRAALAWFQYKVSVSIVSCLRTLWMTTFPKASHSSSWGCAFRLLRVKCLPSSDTMIVSRRPSSEYP